MEKTIIIRLLGGLGNQLFQYALARKIAYQSGAVLKLDISCFNEYNLRRYGLKNFNIMEIFATKKEIDILKSGNIIFEWANRLKNSENKPDTYYPEKVFNYDPEVLNIKGSIYLDGYWQSELYFRDIEDIIKKEFTVKAEPDKVNRELSHRILQENSVSVHIRRGDYITNPDTNQYHGVCPIEYYYLSIAKISKMVKNPVFYVFSDDHQWTRDNLKVDYPVFFVDVNDENKDYEDLRLMTHCKHHIIANSSFSWWGAWLGIHQKKIVIAPKKWFNKLEIDTRDLIPSAWIKV
jgi:hypothetical protein